ncbi:MAG: NifB/NifX family molybdenum-iron cluster-binding protein [Clostridia bacterium]|nr:NifB/NifX family molybdenum-iron cluster-binding protein [Clostridia bacterium]
MKIALPAEARDSHGEVCPSFGRAPLFLIHDTETGTSVFLDNAAATSMGGAGIKAAQTLIDSGVGAVITPRSGQNAAEVLISAGIQVYRSTTGSLADNIAKYQAGTLQTLTDIHPGFHKHGSR